MYLFKRGLLAQAGDRVGLSAVTERQSQHRIVSSRLQLNGLNLGHNSSAIGDAQRRHIGQAHAREIGGDVSDILGRQRPLELEFVTGEIAFGVGRVQADQNIAVAHIAHGLQSGLQVGRHGAGIGTVSHLTGHDAVQLDREGAARLRHIHDEVRHGQGGNIQTEQAATKGDIESPSRRIAHADSGTTQTAERRVQCGLDLNSCGIQGQRCRGVALPAVVQRQLEAAGAVTAVNRDALYLSHFGLRSLHRVFEDFPRRESQACLWNFDKLQVAHKADPVSLGLSCGLVVTDGDIGAVGAQCCGIG